MVSTVALLASTILAAPLPPDRPVTFVTFKGQVVWKGDIPELVPINPPFARLPAPIPPTDLLIDPKSKGLKNVVVWLRPDTEKPEDPFPPDRIHDDLKKPKPVARKVVARDFQFEPRITAARAGDTMEFANPSPVAINVKYDADTVNFNVVLKPDDSYVPEKPLAAQRIPVSFICNIYPWMVGRVRVFDHPYFALTDDQGRFEMPNVPTGSWRIVYWHEQGFHKGRDGFLGFPLEVKKQLNDDTMESKPLEFEIVKPKPN